MARQYHRSVTTPAAARLARPEVRPFVSLLSDFGSRDPSPAIMRAVVLGIAPDASVVDVSHEVDKYAVRDGALLMWCTVPYTPVGVHVAVVDPGVGTDRRPLALETLRGDYLVGPDNGILIPAAARLGGVTRAHVLENPQYRLPVVSTSFHGRDIFAPAAAHLAMGVPLEFFGPSLDPRSLVLLDWPEPEVYDGLLRTNVIYLDTFGNVKFSALNGHMLNAFPGLSAGDRLYVRIEDGSMSRDIAVPWAGTFGHVAVGQPLLYDDSYGRLCLAINQGSAVRTLGIHSNATVTITRNPLPRPAAVVRGASAPVTAPSSSPAERATVLDIPTQRRSEVPAPEPAAPPKAELQVEAPVEPEPQPQPEPEPMLQAQVESEPELMLQAQVESEPELMLQARVEPEPELIPEPVEAVAIPVEAPKTPRRRTRTSTKAAPPAEPLAEQPAQSEMADEAVSVEAGSNGTAEPAMELMAVPMDVAVPEPAGARRRRAFPRTEE